MSNLKGKLRLKKMGIILTINFVLWKKLLNGTGMG